MTRDTPLDNAKRARRALRITVVGAGAIGGTLAVRLACAGHMVSVLTRGATLKALHEGPASLSDLDGMHQARLAAYDSAPHVEDGAVVMREASAAAIGPQDLVITAVKAHALPGVASMVPPLLGKGTRVMPLVNGVPWWYFQGMGTRGADAATVHTTKPHAMIARPIAALDPEGLLARCIAPERIVGAVVYMTGHTPSAGVYVANNPHRLIIGGIGETDDVGHDGDASTEMSLFCIAAGFNDAGIVTHRSANIRADIWAKLAGNLTSNPLSVLTGATLEQIYGEPDLLLTVRPMLQEIRALSKALSVSLPFEDDAFLARCRGMGAVKTSMLQDAERGRPLEMGAIGDAVLELATRADVAMPVTTSVLGLVRRHVSSAPRP
ncbi:hypothetical protein WM40_10855 [Robbsia andropogonis]|uniref:2-dehydropantoate 2-reductase n=1 Tax=Robbsia andropogonis TaxID=28092 RepID=A0A0F5K0S4_9BURK|nr:2-dehydropantoate 2-reductase [Robbsia andropogonis]KKB63515.1 hypothetical protein WM40_10855 [Robbsia andropogonis]